MGALVLAVGAGWLAYRRGHWWIAAVPLGVAVIAGFVIVATERPLEVTPVPFALVVAIGAMGGLWARSRHASP